MKRGDVVQEVYVFGRGILGPAEQEKGKNHQRRAAIPRTIVKQDGDVIWQRRLCRLLQQLFRFIDLCGEIRATAAIGVVQQHE